MRLQVRLTVVEWEDLPVIHSFVQFAFRMPVSVRRSAAEMIIAMLQSNPQKRPSVNKLYLFEFIKGHHIPSFLPSSCLTMAPRADEIEGGDIGYNRKPLLEINDNLGITEVILRHFSCSVQSCDRSSRRNVNQFNDPVESVQCLMPAAFRGK